MSRISRYKFLKKIFNNYIVLIYKDNKYYTYGIDAYMYYHKCNKDIKKIERLRINYVIVDNLEEVMNYYNRYDYDKYNVRNIIDEELKNF